MIYILFGLNFILVFVLAAFAIQSRLMLIEFMDEAKEIIDQFASNNTAVNNKLNTVILDLLQKENVEYLKSKGIK